MLRTQKKWFDISIDTEGQLVSKTFELDKTVAFIIGLLLTSDRDDLLYYRGSQKIELNKEEFFPDGYESKLLMSGINISPKQRYYELGRVPAGSGSLKISYQDTPNALTSFEPYRIRIYVDCEMS